MGWRANASVYDECRVRTTVHELIRARRAPLREIELLNEMAGFRTTARDAMAAADVSVPHHGGFKLHCKGVYTQY